jgi:hypothetical protein
MFVWNGAMLPVPPAGIHCASFFSCHSRSIGKQTAHWTATIAATANSVRKLNWKRRRGEGEDMTAILAKPACVANPLPNELLAPCLGNVQS